MTRFFLNFFYWLNRFKNILKSSSKLSRKIDLSRLRGVNWSSLRSLYLNRLKLFLFILTRVNIKIWRVPFSRFSRRRFSMSPWIRSRREISYRNFRDFSHRLFRLISYWNFSLRRLWFISRWELSHRRFRVVYNRRFRFRSYLINRRFRLRSYLINRRFRLRSRVVNRCPNLIINWTWILTDCRRFRWVFFHWRSARRLLRRLFTHLSGIRLFLIKNILFMQNSM